MAQTYKNTFYWAAITGDLFLGNDTDYVVADCDAYPWASIYTEGYYDGKKAGFITCKCTINSFQSSDYMYYWRFWTEHGVSIRRFDALTHTSFATNFYGHKIADYYHEF